METRPKFCGFFLAGGLEGAAGELRFELVLVLGPIAEVSKVFYVPSFGGEDSSSANYGEAAILRNQTSSLGPRGRAASLLLHMADMCREARMSIGKGRVGNFHAARQILQILRERFAPDAIDVIGQDVATFMDSKRTYQTADAFLMDRMCCAEGQRRGW